MVDIIVQLLSINHFFIIFIKTHYIQTFIIIILNVYHITINKTLHCLCTGTKKS